MKQMMKLNESIFDWFKPKKGLAIDYDSDKLSVQQLKQYEKERFTCVDCGEKDYNMYMVNDEIWKKYGNKKLTLCKSCLEKRMGRELTKDDISQHKESLVNKHNPEFKKFYNLQEQVNRIKNLIHLLSEDVNNNFIAYKGVDLEFDTNRDGPMFFTKYYEGAHYYGIEKLRGRVLKAIISFKNPLIVNAHTYPRGRGYGEGIPMYKDENGDKSQMSDNFIGTFSDDDINEKVMKLGYDGVIINKKYGDPIDGWEVLSFNRDTRKFID